MVGDVHVVADVMQQRSDFKDQSRFGIQLMNYFDLIKDLYGQLSDGDAMFLIEKVFLTQTSRRLDNLFAMKMFFPVSKLGQKIQQNAIFQSNPGNHDFSNA